MRRSGTADLPLHGGRVPPWLATRMAELGRAIVTVLVDTRGPSEVLTRLSDPFWFQALGCVMGMDWHSSGITTSVMGALKKAINPLAADLGLYVCGGRGAHSRRTPDELLRHADRTGLDGNSLVHASRLSAKVDNTCVQDGFSLYLHSFVVSREGEWAVIQQGMSDARGMARRYHWHSPTVRSFVDDPHSAIVGQNRGEILNLSDTRAEENRKGIVEFLAQHPDRQLREMRHLAMDRPHQIQPRHVESKRLGAVLALAYEKQFRSFVDALLLPGVGPRTIQSLALVSEVIFGAPGRFTDPARFSFAHGGKDGTPFPVPLKVYDESLAVLKQAVDRARIDRSDKVRGLRRLEGLTRLVEGGYDPRADVRKVIAHEWKHTHAYGGRTAGGAAGPSRVSRPAENQLSLFDDGD
ncbi:MAG: DUF763 domain-containing protein [Chitinivibrionales bacterium]|nr:DUF763 domain-containing protein [Chitinivibrionales bacterium]MBD3394062.1 DUF763 domain-containing protein [Chitinivibrionales bacterium]